MIKEITMTEFNERFFEVSIYDIWNTTAYLENGVILLDSEWNGEEYNVDGTHYKPVFDWSNYADQGTVLGYEVRNE